MGVPTMYVRLLAEAGLTRDACRGMRLFISGSAPLLIDTFNEFRERSGDTILERYGMSETLMLTSNPCDPANGERCAGTVGPALPGVSLRVRNDAGAELAAGEVGGIEVRGPNVFKGYWRMAEKTREEFSADGWFKTGDIGKVDSRGYVSIVGRSKDLIITGGYNVYPAEIEAVLNEMPGVAESAVIGVPHPDFGEGVIAVLVARPGQCIDIAALVAGLKSKIANFKVPKRVFVVRGTPAQCDGQGAEDAAARAASRVVRGAVMVIFGTTLLAVCYLLGIIIGDALGSLIGVKANVGGVGFAMILLIASLHYLHERGLMTLGTERGITFWAAMYIPVVVAMSATQNVLVAFKSGMVAVLGAAGSVIVCACVISAFNRVIERRGVDPAWQNTISSADNK